MIETSLVPLHCLFCSHVDLVCCDSQTLAGHLLSRLGDEELTNRVEASSLFAKLGTSKACLLVLMLLVLVPYAAQMCVDGYGMWVIHFSATLLAGCQHKRIHRSYSVLMREIISAINSNCMTHTLSLSQIPRLLCQLWSISSSQMMGVFVLLQAPLFLLS